MDVTDGISFTCWFVVDCGIFILVKKLRLTCTFWNKGGLGRQSVRVCLYYWRKESPRALATFSTTCSEWLAFTQLTSDSFWSRLIYSHHTEFGQLSPGQNCESLRVYVGGWLSRRFAVRSVLNGFRIVLQLTQRIFLPWNCSCVFMRPVKPFGVLL